MKSFLLIALVPLCLMFSVVEVQAQRTVTMRLNMASVPDTTNGVGLMEVRGAGGTDGTISPDTLADANIIDWSATSTLELKNEKGPDGQDSDYWRISFEISDTTRLQHKFYSQQLEDAGLNGWEADPNPYIEPGEGDVDLGLHFFQGQHIWRGMSGRRNSDGELPDYNWRPWEAKEDSIAIWYRVVMLGQHSDEKGYDPMMNAPDQIIGVRGADIKDATDETIVGPLSWGQNNVVLDRESMDEKVAGYNTYSGVAYYPSSLAGLTQEYKFVTAHGEMVGWEEGANLPSNRTFVVPDSDSTLHWVYYGNTAPSPNKPVEGQVVFGVDMSAFETIGLFDTARGDTLWVFGDFNAWADCRVNTPDDCYMFREPGGTIFQVPVALERPVGVNQGYKYFLDFNDVTFMEAFNSAPPSGWEEGHRTGVNRQFDFQGGQQRLDLAYFNDVTPNNVMKEGTSVELMFSVDMQEALDSEAAPFMPATDTVTVHLGDPIWAHTQGIDGTDHDIPLWDDVQLTDSDGDGTYTGSYTAKGPSYNIITFRYMYGTKSTSTQEMGSDTRVPGRNRVHFIPMNADGSFPAKYELPAHSFKLTPGPLPHDVNPHISTSIQQSQELPSEIWLGSNYPNPFNPATTIEFGLTQQADAQLHVYDLLGRRVATLIDGVLQAANYTVTFDASHLASGVYIYRLQTPEVAITKQMTLLK
ncbi:MAG: T9SS type A sorting domain-containing protein [Bacteroidetes bacterium]|nr:T9SS type A sorting domain-containing protein [Bacteroidota bacterium]